MEKESFGTYMLDGEIIDIDTITLEKLEEQNRKFANNIESEREKLNDILSSILI